MKPENKKRRIIEDKKARAATGIRSTREALVFKAPLQLTMDAESEEGELLSSPRNCYVCKKEFTRLHHFYDTMCKEYGDLNYVKRFQTADLTGQVTLITGSRLKIGYHITLIMLRAGATVIATMRFPVDSAIRFAKEKDYRRWKHRLKIHGLDLRHIPSVELFADYIEQEYDRMDILINNATQTVRRPPGFYAHMMENELLDASQIPEEVHLLLKDHFFRVKELESFARSQSNNNEALPVTWNGQEPGIGMRASAKLSQIPYRLDNAEETKEIFLAGKLDADLQQVDLRKTNSWRLKPGEINTAAGDLAKSGIYMNAVDTGWVTDEDPVELAKKKEDIHDFQPPLDIVDGAARVIDPLFDGINTGKHWCGKFLKDYFPIDW